MILTLMISLFVLKNFFSDSFTCFNFFLSTPFPLYSIPLLLDFLVDEFHFSEGKPEDSSFMASNVGIGAFREPNSEHLRDTQSHVMLQTYAP